MESGPSLRAIQAQREAARRHLRSLIESLAVLSHMAGISRPVQDFKEEFKILKWLNESSSPGSDDSNTTRAFSNNLKATMKRFGRSEKVVEARPELTDLTTRVPGKKVVGAFVASVFSILRSSIDGTAPSEETMEHLSAAINETAFIEYRRLSSGTSVYRITSNNGLRTAAEDLIRYFKLIFECDGPVHAGCERCNSMFITKRGGKKFCSDECREERWSYANRSEYLKAYQRNSTAGVRQRGKGGKH